MKKIVLTTVCAMAVTGLAFAQGDVTWQNPSFSFIEAQTNAALYSPIFGGGAANGTVGNASSLTPGPTPGTPGGVYYELLYGGINNAGVQIAGASAPSNALAAVNPLFAPVGVWHDTGLGLTNQSTSGRLASTMLTTQATVPWPSTQTNNILLVGWSADLGSSWLTVSNELATGSYISILAGQEGFFGVSMAGYVEGDASNPGVNLFAGAASYGLPIDMPVASQMSLYLLPVPEPTTMVLAGLGGLSLLLLRRRK